MKFIALKMFIITCSSVFYSLSTPQLPVNGKIIQQHFDQNNEGITIIKLWGTYREMGYAHGVLFAREICDMIEQTKKMVDADVPYENFDYNTLKAGTK